jgi:hypothetical protein
MQTIENTPVLSSLAVRCDPAVSDHLAHRIQRDHTERFDKLWGGRPLLKRQRLSWFNR